MEYYNKLELTQQHLKDNIKNIKDITISDMGVDIIFEDNSKIGLCFDGADIILHIPESVSAMMDLD